MKLGKEILQLVPLCALGAWRLLPQEKEPTSSFSNIKQKPEEPYEDFVSRLTEAINRVISSTEASEILIKQLAFENANSTCQAILHTIRKSGQVGDFNRQCADVGPAMMQSVAMAAAIKGDSCQQAVHPFLQAKIPAIKAGMLACPKPAFLVARRGTLRTPAPNEQLILLCQTLPPRL